MQARLRCCEQQSRRSELLLPISLHRPRAKARLPWAPAGMSRGGGGEATGEALGGEMAVVGAAGLGQWLRQGAVDKPAMHRRLYKAASLRAEFDGSHLGRRRAGSGPWTAPVPLH